MDLDSQVGQRRESMVLLMLHQTHGVLERQASSESLNPQPALMTTQHPIRSQSSWCTMDAQLAQRMVQ